MSAFVVDRAHIDALVTLAVRGPSDAKHWQAGGQFSWTADPDAHWADPKRYGKADYDSADALGFMLWAENTASVEGRYPDVLEGGTYPGPADFDPTHTLVYSWPFASPRVSAVAGLKALSCYEYQSCEHEGWETSEAKRFCDSLRVNLIGELPGYDAAPWCIYDEGAA